MPDQAQNAISPALHSGHDELRSMGHEDHGYFALWMRLAKTQRILRHCEPLRPREIVWMVVYYSLLLFSAECGEISRLCVSDLFSLLNTLLNQALMFEPSFTRILPLSGLFFMKNYDSVGTR